MLNHRPIAQKALVAVGTFAFVFGSAMAGTGFMLTGGFGYADENNPSVRSPDYGYVYAFMPKTEVAAYEEAYEDAYATPVAWAEPSERPIGYVEQTSLSVEPAVEPVVLDGDGEEAALIPEPIVEELPVEESLDEFADFENADSAALPEPLPEELALDHDTEAAF